MSHSFRVLLVISMAFVHGGCSGGDGPKSSMEAFSLAISLVGAGRVTSTTAGLEGCATGAASCEATFKRGTDITLSALATDGSTFSHWSGACSGTSAVCTVKMSEVQSVSANFLSIPNCTSDGATNLATTITDASGVMTTNIAPNRKCPKALWGQVTGICYGDYAVQVNAYGTPPPNTHFSMWSQSASCWGVKVSEPANPKFVYWNAPIVTRGFSFGYTAPLATSGGLSVANLATQHAKAVQPCPDKGTASSVCVKWSMEVPGVIPQSTVNTAKVTYSNWDAMIDIYFHAVPNPAPGTSVTFDLQIYQMLMDWQATNGPNWATNILGRYTTKTIGKVKYLVTVNTQNPGTQGSNWVGLGGQLNAVSMFALPTLPTTRAAGGVGSYLWGTPSAMHDVGGIIAWLSQMQTVNGVTAIFDDEGKPLYDNVRKAPVTSPLISPTYYLTGLNPGFEVIQANASDPAYSNNGVYKTTNYWVALPGEDIGK